MELVRGRNLAFACELVKLRRNKHGVGTESIRGEICVD